MSMKFTAPLVLILLTGGAAAQISVTVGPSPAPVGSQIAISVANDTNQAIFLPNPCPFVVKDSNGTPIYTPFCIQIIVNVNAGGVFTTYWSQIDDGNNQVAPGTYFVDVNFPGGTSTTSIVIDPQTAAAAAQLGPTRVGTNRHLYLTSAPANGDGAFAYLMAASGIPTMGGIPTCGGIVPLQDDVILQLSLTTNPYLLGFSGFLGNTATSTTPSISVPNVPGINGTTFVVAFVVLDPNAPCIVRRISAPLLIFVV
jgi:hypothetical protein